MRAPCSAAVFHGPGHPFDGQLLACSPDSCSTDPVCNLAGSPCPPHPFLDDPQAHFSIPSQPALSFTALDLEFELEIIYFLPAPPWGAGSGQQEFCLLVSLPLFHHLPE